MKKLTAMLTAVMLVLSLSACGGTPSAPAASQPAAPAASAAAAGTGCGRRTRRGRQI